MGSPIFSILLPVYNRESLIKRAIDSMLSQSFPRWELLICNDGSTDKTKERIASRLGDPRITFVENRENQGPSAARNRLLPLARGRYIGFLDSDDFLYPRALECYHRILEDHPEIDVLTSTFEDSVNGKFDPSFRKKIRRHIHPNLPQDKSFLDIDLDEALKKEEDRNAFFLLCQCMFKAGLFEGVRFPEELRVGEDQVVLREIAHKGAHFQSRDFLSYSYQIHGENLHLTSPRVKSKTVDLGMIIPYRGREKIVNQMLALSEIPDWVSLYIVEQDGEPSFPDPLRSKLDGYTFIKDAGPFNRSLCFNEGVRKWDHPYYLFHDCDLVCWKDFFQKIRHKILNSPFDFFLPWDQILYLDKETTEDLKRGEDVSGVATDRPLGGSILFDREFFLRIGGMNEDFKGWGHEDFELIERCNWHRDSKALIRNHSTLYHLWHGYLPTKPPVSLTRSDQYMENCNLLNWIRQIEKQDRADITEKLINRFNRRPKDSNEYLLISRGSMRENPLKEHDALSNIPVLHLHSDDPLFDDLVQKIESNDEIGLSLPEQLAIESRKSRELDIIDFQEEEILEDWVLDLDDQGTEHIVLGELTKKKILICADVEGWAFDRIAKRMAQLLSSEYDVDVVYSSLGYSTIANLAEVSADVFICLGYPNFKGICRGRPLIKKTIFCGYDHLHYENPPRDPDILFLEDEIAWIKEVASITTSSELLQRICQTYFPDKEIHLVRDGVDCSEFRPTNKREFTKKVRVGWCGKTNGSTLKGVELIETACKRNGMEFLCLDASKRGKPQTDMLSFYDSIDVYVCASLCEGTPNPILEASACGVPWISTPVGIVPELWRESLSGIIINRNVEELTRALWWYTVFPHHRKTFSERLRKVVQENFSWEERLSPIRDAIKSVLKRRTV